MTDFFIKHLDEVFLLYGLSFVIMGAAVIAQLNVIRESRFKLLDSLWLLAWFGLIHGVNEFIDMFTLSHGQLPISKILSTSCLVTSFIFLFCFGYRLCNSGKTRVFSAWLGITAILVFLVSVFITAPASEAGLANSARYFIGFPGALMSAIGFIGYYRANNKEFRALGAGKYFITAGLALGLYAVIAGLIGKRSDFFPSSVVNMESFIAVVHLPAQFFRAICAIAITFSVCNVMVIFEAEESEKRKKLSNACRLLDIGTLAVTVAHELRTPLAAINMAAYNIRQKAQSPLIEKHISTIIKKVAEGNQIINNLLFYFRIKEPRYEDVNMREILLDCINDARAQFGDDVVVSEDLDSIKDVLIKADPFQLKEVFINVLNNARDAVMGGKAEIALRADKGADSVKVHIKDNGVGIGPEELKKVFDPFFTTKSKGSGLGLTISREIMEKHNGTILIDSKQGAGTDVSITLPLAQLSKEKSEKG